ncbi:MAG: S8 family peptidase, partial [Planctomycetota bacterium]|nr:S8 family peptidase [Planctomycetota bacterium]
MPVSRRRPKRALHHESLEPRLCLSANIGTGIDQLTSQLDWGGQSVTARADSWILRTDGALSSNFGGWLFDRSADTAWQSESLGEGFFSLTTPGATAEDVLGWASTTHGVAYVEPDFVINQASTPNDPDLSRLWGLHNTGQTGGVDDADIDALEAWNITTGSRDVVIAVIDTGVDYTHRDLAANAWQNPGEIPGNGVDDDGNGFVDDIYGYDFVNNDGDPMDDNGHGTHVAGTIGGVGNDGTGIVGVNWQISIMGLKFLSGGGSGSTSDAVRAVNYATIMRRDHGINIVATNNSWGGGGFSQSLSDAIEGGGNAGILFIAAAGNEGNNNDTFPGYPASMTSEAIISVAATDSSNNLAGFSNYGATSVDVGAPGVGIYSALPGNGYASYSGTSMATPHVAGIVGLLAAANPNLTAAEIRTAILDTAVPISSLNGRVATGGLANAAAALDAISTGPSLRADIVNVAPDPRQDAVDAITIAFTSAVSGFDLADLALTRDGTAVALAGTATLASSDQQTWTLGGLATLTADLGAYQLTLAADGSGITNGDGLTLAADVTDSWLVVEPPPPAPFEPNDSIATAAPVALTAGRAAFSGIVGDGSYALADVDLFSIELAAGATITLDVDARSLTPASTLDSYLRLFDASGRQLAYNDDT